MIKTTDAESLLAALVLALKNSVNGSKHCYSQALRGERAEADKQYFMGGLDAVTMVARQLGESGLVDREAFLAEIGLTP